MDQLCENFSRLTHIRREYIYPLRNYAETGATWPSPALDRLALALLEAALNSAETAMRRFFDG